MAAKKRLTNEQMVAKMMKFSPYGALAQLFVVDALSKQADAVAALTDEQVAAMDKENPFVSMETWRGVARDVKRQLDEHLEK